MLHFTAVSGSCLGMAENGRTASSARLATHALVQFGVTGQSCKDEATTPG